MSHSPDDDPIPWPATRVLAATALALMLVAGSALVFLPIGWQINRFIIWLYYFNIDTFGIRGISLDGYAFLLNVALFAVPTVRLATVWPRVWRPVWLVLGFCASVGIEAVQRRYLPREADWDDVLANTLGTFLGIIVLDLWRRTTSGSRTRSW